jgi:hypothetical protein
LGAARLAAGLAAWRALLAAARWRALGLQAFLEFLASAVERGLTVRGVAATPMGM